MADISEPHGIEPSLGVDPRPHQEQRGRREENAPGGKDEVPQPPSRDVASVMGIPEEELTPKVQEALNRLLDQFDSLREQLVQSRSRNSYLHDLADSHPYLSVMNRRAFLRELARLQSRAERVATSNTFIYVHLSNADEIRRTLGRSAYEKLMAVTARSLMDRLRATDVLGSLGGTDFGLILTLADGKVAREKMQELKSAIEKLTLSWQGHDIHLTTVLGMHVFEAGETVDAVLDAADKDLLAQQSARSETLKSQSQPAPEYGEGESGEEADGEVEARAKGNART